MKSRGPPAESGRAVSITYKKDTLTCEKHLSAKNSEVLLFLGHSYSTAVEKDSVLCYNIMQLKNCRRKYPGILYVPPEDG